MIGNGGTVAAQGKVTAVFKWNDLNNPFPGGKVVILIKSKAEGEAKIEVPIALNPGTILLPPAQQPPDIEDGVPGVTSRARFGSQLFTKDVAPGAIEMKQEISISSIANTTANDGATVRVAAVAALDNRSVKITRNSKDRFELGADGSWITYGDTVYSYNWANPPHQVAGPQMSLHENKQRLYSAPEGGWNSHVYGYTIHNEPIYYYGDTRIWAPMGDPEDPWSSTQLMPTSQTPLSSSGKWTTPFGSEGTRTERTVDYTLIGSDGAIAKAKYIFTVHDAIEKEREQTYNAWAYCPVWGSGAMPNNADGVLQPNGPLDKDGQNNPSISVGHGSSQGVSIGVNGEFGIEELGAGFGASLEWNTEQSSSVEQSSTVNIDVPAGFFTYPLFEDKYVRHEYFYRHYTEEGEHTLPSVEFPPGSGYYDTPIHQWTYDEPSGRTVVWAPPVPIGTAIPTYSNVPVRPTPIRSGGNS